MRMDRNGCSKGANRGSSRLSRNSRKKLAEEEEEFDMCRELILAPTPTSQGPHIQALIWFQALLLASARDPAEPQQEAESAHHGELKLVSGGEGAGRGAG